MQLDGSAAASHSRGSSVRARPAPSLPSWHQHGSRQSPLQHHRQRQAHRSGSAVSALVTRSTYDVPRRASCRASFFSCCTLRYCWRTAAPPRLYLRTEGRMHR